MYLARTQASHSVVLVLTLAMQLPLQLCRHVLKLLIACLLVFLRLLQSVAVHCRVLQRVAV